MDPRPRRALRAIEDLRLQLVVDRLVAEGALCPEDALSAPGGPERVLAERGVLGLDLEALRRQARQMRRHAVVQQQAALTQRDAASAQWARAVDRLESDFGPANPPRAGTARRA